MKGFDKQVIVEFVNEWRRRPDWQSRCFYCGIQLMNSTPLVPQSKTREHVIPRVRGKRSSHSVVRSCYQCNCDRGCLDLNEFRTRKRWNQFYAEIKLQKMIVKRPTLREQLGYEMHIYNSRVGQIIARLGRGETR